SRDRSGGYRLGMSSKPKRFVAPPPRSANLPEPGPSLRELPDNPSAEGLDRLTIDVAHRIASDPSASARDRFLALERLRELTTPDGALASAGSRRFADDVPEAERREALEFELE